MMALPTEGTKEKPPLHVYPEAKIGTRFYSHLGIQSTRYNGVCALTGSMVLMASGRFIMFVDVSTGKIESMPGPIDGGVGAIAVHPSRKYFVVCEKRPQNPLIRAYSWPSRVEMGEFVGGATKGFSACCFNADGTMMATVGMYPDFSLAVWDWKTRGMILRNKCHSADVYSVAFSQFDSGVLVTGGAGHIKFWSMAKTFTGLKLQGLLGKFGRLDISNVPGFAVLPDGKVLSGTEDGLILIWEGDLVRCCFASDVVKEIEGDEEEAAGLALQSYAYIPCHAGPINVVQLLGNGSVLLTAGDDGCMRYWRVSELERAEGEGIPPLYAPVCLCEVLVDENARIRAVTHSRDTNEWVVLDSTGSLWHLPFLHPDEILSGLPKQMNEPAVAALRFNGGAITSAALSPCDHTIVTGGEDGSIRLIDYVTPREVYCLQPPDPNTVVGLRFFQSDKTGMKFVACCDDGTVRLLQRGKSGFALLGQWRPHNAGLKTFAVDKEERRLCTLSESGALFFFNIEPELNSLIPIGYCQLPVPNPLCVAWDDATSTCLVGHESGKILAVRAATMKDVDQSISFEFPCTYALVGIRQRKVAEKRPINLVPGEREEDVMEEEEEEDLGPWPVRVICPLPDGSFAIGAGGVELLYEYNTNIRYDGLTELPPLPPTGIEPPDYVEEPIINLCYRDLIPLDASLSVSKHSLVVICEGAQMFIRTLDDSYQWKQNCILVSSAHDRLDGHIAAACTSFDDTMLVSAGSDGLVVAQLLDGCNAPARPQIDSMYPSLHAEEVVVPEPIPLSISEQKEEDDRRRAEEAKQCELEAFLDKLHVVHAKYAELLKENSEIPKDLQLSENEMILHPQIIKDLEEEKAKRVRDSRMDTALELAREDVRTTKMRKRFIDNLIYDRFLVYSFSQEFAVASFRTPDPTEAIERFEAKITELLESDKDDGVGLENSFANNDNKSKHVEVNEDSLCNLALSTAAAITEWLLLEEQKQQQERQKHNRGDGEVLTSTMRQHLDKLDDRREERRRRKKGHEILLSHKPDPEKESERLDEELKFEIARRGDFVLRTDPLYHLVPSAVAKLRQLIKLERVLVDLRSSFTKKLLLMRDEKAKLCASLNIFLARIRAINEKLKDDTIPAADITLQDIELPEKRFTVDRDGLDAFAKQRQLEKEREEMAKKAQRGFGADLAAGDTTSVTTAQTNVNSGVSGASPNPAGRASLHSEIIDNDSASTKRTSTRISVGEGRPSTSRRSKNLRFSSAAPKASRSQSTAFLAAAAVRERMDYDLRVKLENVKPTEAEEEEQNMERELLIAERRQLLCRVNAIMKEFDERLWEMYEERAKVDADLCLAHTRSLLLFHEYQILLVFRQKDRELQRQYEEAKCSRNKRKKEMEELQKGVQQQIKEIEKLQDTSKAFRHEVEYFIESNFPPEHIPYITKVFLRQIKRRKHLGDISADDDDITSDDDDEEINEDDLWEEVCPPHCSEERWREVLAKREIRLDYADSIAEARRKQEQMQRSIDEHVVLAEQHDAVLTSCLKAIEDFQNEKRKQLNMLGTLVMLRCSQVKCLGEDEKCPETFCRDDLVVVSDNVVSGLHRRIETMAEEKRERRLTLKNMASDLQRLQRERAAKEALHAQWEEKIYEAMLLKFGQVVNLELLESTSGCRAVEEMKERLRAEELAWERALRSRERTIARLRERLQDSLLRNTHLLHDLGDQASDKHAVDGALVRATQNVVGRMYDGAQVATEEDRRNLRLLIAAQQEEIDALMAEISMLRSKGGHVYAPTTTISI
ncbi:flagellar associated protein [Trypanosoma theileri]|uniref:Flagellar associated protein n=1 Tax=Trypanosoma theileri TaxID=67003 RepID=A0A1X0NNE2_9TRYP|nr:flagellar associated protein [Trypanosoma theileri]ORC86235.1 flagellar associated protein [Trypanosoma theileri]